MQPAAILSVLVSAEGVGPTNAKLSSVQSTLQKTALAGDTAGSSVARAGAKMEKAGTGMMRVGKAATKYYATPLLAAAGAALYFGQKYEKSMLMVQTHTDTNRKDLQLYKREILEMGSSGKYVQGPAELGEAMYHIASDGYKGVAATTMLKKSADLAMVGQSDLAESTYALVSAMKTGIRGTETSGAAINNLNAIVGAGDMKMQEMVGAMSTGILPAAKAMGLSLRDVGVAEDIMTQRGVPAQQAAYRLAMTFQMLIPHTEKAEKAFHGIGLSNMSLIETMEKHPKEGLVSALELLENHLRKFEGPKGVDQIQMIEEIFGGGRTSRGAITLLQNLDSVKETYGRINQLAGETPKKIAEAKAAPVNKLKEAWVQVETVLTELGSDLIPMVAQGITWLAHGIENVAHWFHSLPEGTQAWIIKLLALTVALAFLIRIIGFFVKSFGIMIGWFAKAEVETATVVAANETLAASYGETAVAAEASAAAQTAAIEEVAAAQKIAQAAALGGMPIGWAPGQQSMGQLMPEAEGAAGQMSLFASKGAGAVEGAGAAEAGTASAGAFAGAMSAALPAAVGAIGVGNIFTSVTHGDMQDAGAETGGAIAGGIAGFFLTGGNPLGAAAGASIGSIVAGWISEGIGGSEQKSVLERAIEQAGEGVSEAVHRQHKAAKSLKKSSDVVGIAQNKQKRISGRVADAQEDLNKAQNRYGKSSRQAATALERLHSLKLKEVGANRRLAESEKLQGVRRTATIRSDQTSIARMREKKDLVREEVSQLEKRLGLIQKEPASEVRGQKEKHKETQITDALSGIRKIKAEEEKIFSASRVQIGERFAKSLEKLNPYLHDTKVRAKEAGESVDEYYKQWGKNLMSGKNPLLGQINALKQSKTHAEETGKQIAGPFKNQSQTGFSNASASAQSFEKAATTALTTVGTSTNSMLKALGAKPVGFGAHSEKQKTVKKARGGEISIGAPSGDSVHAVLEKGEYVVNREAVSKVGVHKLNELNFGKAPRFQEGGAVGSVSAALAEAQRISGTPYVWGGGHTGFSLSPDGLDCSGAVSNVLWAANLLNKPLTSSGFMDWGQPGPGDLTIHANPEHVWMEIMGKPYGTSVDDSSHGLGFYGKPPASYTSEFVTRHASGAVAEALKKITMTGPEGELKQIGQQSIESVESAANKYIKAHEPGGFGGGDANIAGGTPSAVMAAIGKELFAHGANKIGAAGIIGNAVGESNLVPGSEGTGGGGLWGFTTPPISLANLKEHASELHRPWTEVGLQTRFMLEHGGQEMIPRVNAASSAGESTRIFMEGWEHPGIPRLDVREAGAQEALAAGWQKGGEVKKGDSSGKGSIEKAIKNTLKGIEGGKHLPVFDSHLKKINRRISKTDLPHSQMNRLGGLTNETEKYSEYASNASSLTKTDEDGKVTQGLFKGGTEGHWLQSELDSLISLRKQVVASHEVIGMKTLPQILKLLKHTQHRLRAAQKAIRIDEAKKRELKKKIQDLEKVHNDNVRKIEKEKNELEHKLNTEQNAKSPNQNAIKAIRSEIQSKNEAIGSDKKEATAAIKDDNEKIKDVEKDVRDKKRVETAAQSFVTTLTGRRTSLYDTMSNLYGQGGEFEGTGLSFYGLEQIQGKGSPTGDIPNPPELGSVGGEIFSVQNRLREIQEELEKKPVTGADESGTEIAELERELAIEYKKKYMVSQAQFDVLSNFPSVGSIASIPKAGSYATGGMVAATVGERGKEVAIMPTGSRVVPEHDAKEAIARMGGGGATHLNFEELNLHEADSRVSGRLNGQDFDEEVGRVNRKTARGSMAPTPGGRGRNK